MKDIRRQVERADRAPSSSRTPAPASASASQADSMPVGRRHCRDAAPARPARASRQVVADYVALTKPKVQSLLLLTTVGDDVRRRRPVGRPRRWLTCLGGYLVGRRRGRRQPLLRPRHRRARWRARPTGRCRRAGSRPRAALSFGIVLAALSFAAADDRREPRWRPCWRSSGFLGYVVVYTVWLKRRTPQNIVIGGAAGAVPPLVGWAAVDRRRSTGTSIYLFAIVFFWTPPHFWALSLLMKDEYARVGVPMLPVVRGEDETRKPDPALLGAALRRDAAAVLRRRLRRRSTWSPRSCSARVFIGGAVVLLPPRRPPLAPCGCTCSPSPTSRCCSRAMVVDAKL